MECKALGGQRGHAGTRVRLWVIYGALAGPYRHYRPEFGQDPYAQGLI